jgi:hypothetical protein
MYLKGHLDDFHSNFILGKVVAMQGSHATLKRFWIHLQYSSYRQTSKFGHQLCLLSVQLDQLASHSYQQAIRGTL